MSENKLIIVQYPNRGFIGLMQWFQMYQVYDKELLLSNGARPTGSLMKNTKPTIGS